MGSRFHPQERSQRQHDAERGESFGPARTPATRVSTPHVLELQRTVGNRAVADLLTRRQGPVRPFDQPTVTDPAGDPIFVARQPVEVDLEVPPPSERDALRQQGIELPRVSAASADPRAHSDYVDRRVTAVGFGIYLGGYLLYCDGLPLPVFVPESHVDFGMTIVNTPDPSIHADRDEAVAATPFGPPAPGQGNPVTFYRGAGGALITPTTLSPGTTPRFTETALRARAELVVQVQHELAVLAITIVGGLALRAILNRLARVGGQGSEPPPRPRLRLSGNDFGARMAQEMQAQGFRGNEFREFMRRLNALPQRLPPEEAAKAIEVATRNFSSGTRGTMPPVQVGNVLVVPSRAPIPNAPVMGIQANGTIIMGRAPRIEIVPMNPPQARIVGDITWE